MNEIQVHGFTLVSAFHLVFAPTKKAGDKSAFVPSWWMYLFWPAAVVYVLLLAPLFGTYWKIPVVDR